MSSNAEAAPNNQAAWLAAACRTVETEAAGLNALLDSLNGSMAGPFSAAIEVLRTIRGRAILTGVGKSGHIARKIAATLASTGTPALFVHATEASHGDLGMVTSSDVIIALSNSGETAELRDIVHYSRRFSVPLIAITGKADSALGRAADIALTLPDAPEACPIGMAPTTSTTLQLVLGDCLAVALLEDRNFSASDFQRFHPGGKLGAALTHVRDIMHGADRLPLTAADTAMSEALIVMTEKGFGCVGIVDDDGTLTGIITDGDLRRHMRADLLDCHTADIMTKNPRTVSPDTIATAALEKLGQRITSLFVVEDGKPVGIVHVHDLLRIGVK